MATSTTLNMRITMAWWLRYLYLPAVVAVAKLTGLEPDWGKVGRMVERGTTIEVVRG